LNAQYDAGSTPFGLSPAIGHTGAPGSQSNPDASYGPVIASPVVSIPGASSQVAANMPRLPVTTGDTVGMSSDSVVPVPGGDPLTGLGVDFLASTGAGQGTSITEGHHPNSSARG
jgi:hypothetical protein